jgi:intracellular sulfur oxidation DsrE/DsrF family protein
MPATTKFQRKLGEFLMIGIKHLTLGLILAALVGSPVWTAEPAPEGLLRIDVPVTLKPSKVVFNMDHLAFDGDRSIGLNYMKLMAQTYKASQTPISIIAVFHGAAGYMLLNDRAYNTARASDKGNPFKEQISALQQEGIQFEECGETARRRGWVNADLLPGVKVDTGANLRIVQLVQDGYVQIQP